MVKSRLGLDLGHCECMLCLRLPDGTILKLSLDCAGSVKIATALAMLSMPEFIDPDDPTYNPTQCTLIGAALPGYEMLMNLREQTPRDMQKQEISLLLEEIYLQQQHGEYMHDDLFESTFPVPVPCAPEDLPEEMRLALLAKAQEIAGANVRASLHQADFSPVFQYFKMDPVYWTQPCLAPYTHRELMLAFISQLVRSANIYNEASMPIQGNRHYMVGCPASEDWLREESIAAYIDLMGEADPGCEAEIYPEPMAALLSALAARESKGLSMSLNEGFLVDDHGSLTDDHCILVARRNTKNVLEYCRVKCASDRIGGHLIESEMLLRVLQSAGLKSSSLRPVDRNFALQKLRRWKEEYCLGQIPMVADRRELPLRLKDGSRRYVSCSVEDLVWSAVYQTPIDQEKTWYKLCAEYKESVWQQLTNYALPCKHVVLTGGVNNMPAARHIAREVYKGAEFHVEEDTSLSVADGLCRALSADEKRDYRENFNPVLPVSPSESFDGSGSIPLHRSLSEAIAPHMAAAIGRTLALLDKTGIKYSFDDFEKKLLALCNANAELKDAMKRIVAYHASGAYSFVGAQAVEQMPRAFPGCVPALSLQNTFDREIEALCALEPVVKKVVALIAYTFFFPSLGISPRRSASISRYAVQGEPLHSLLLRAMNEMNFVSGVNGELKKLFTKYLFERITYSHFDVDQ